METHIIHMKIDALATQLGHPFLPQDTAANILQRARSHQEAMAGPSHGTVASPPPPQFETPSVDIGLPPTLG